MKPFNLEKALAGEKVITRGGISVKITGFNTNAEKYKQIIGWLNNNIFLWDINGKISADGQSSYDLFMDHVPQICCSYVDIYRDKHGGYHCIDDSICIESEYFQKVGHCEVTWEE